MAYDAFIDAQTAAFHRYNEYDQLINDRIAVETDIRKRYDISSAYDAPIFIKDPAVLNGLAVRNITYVVWSMTLDATQKRAVKKSVDDLYARSNDAITVTIPADEIKYATAAAKWEADAVAAITVSVKKQLENIDLDYHMTCDHDLNEMKRLSDELNDRDYSSKTSSVAAKLTALRQDIAAAAASSPELFSNTCTDIDDAYTASVEKVTALVANATSLNTAAVRILNDAEIIWKKSPDLGFKIDKGAIESAHMRKAVPSFITDNVTTRGYDLTALEAAITNAVREAEAAVKRVDAHYSNALAAVKAYNAIQATHTAAISAMKGSAPRVVSGGSAPPPPPPTFNKLLISDLVSLTQPLGIAVAQIKAVLDSLTDSSSVSSMTLQASKEYLALTAKLGDLKLPTGWRTRAIGTVLNQILDKQYVAILADDKVLRTQKAAIEANAMSATTSAKLSGKYKWNAVMADPPSLKDIMTIDFTDTTAIRDKITTDEMQKGMQADIAIFRKLISDTHATVQSEIAALDAECVKLNVVDTYKRYKRFNTFQAPGADPTSGDVQRYILHRDIAIMDHFATMTRIRDNIASVLCMQTDDALLDCIAIYDYCRAVLAGDKTRARFGDFCPSTVKDFIDSTIELVVEAESIYAAANPASLLTISIDEATAVYNALTMSDAPSLKDIYSSLSTSKMTDNARFVDIIDKLVQLKIDEFPHVTFSPDRFALAGKRLDFWTDVLSLSLNKLVSDGYHLAQKGTKVQSDIIKEQMKANFDEIPKHGSKDHNSYTRSEFNSLIAPELNRWVCTWYATFDNCYTVDKAPFEFALLAAQYEALGASISDVSRYERVYEEVISRSKYYPSDYMPASNVSILFEQADIVEYFKTQWNACLEPFVDKWSRVGAFTEEQVVAAINDLGSHLSEKGACVFAMLMYMQIPLDSSDTAEAHRKKIDSILHFYSSGYRECYTAMSTYAYEEYGFDQVIGTWPNLATRITYLREIADDIDKEEAARIEAEENRLKEADRLAKEREVEGEAARIEADRLAKEADRLAKEAERLAKEEAARIEADRLAKEADRLAKEEAARIEADRLAKEAERLAKEEAARIEAEENRLKEADRLAKEVERLAKEKSVEEERARKEAEAKKIGGHRMTLMDALNKAKTTFPDLAISPSPDRTELVYAHFKDSLTMHHVNALVTTLSTTDKPIAKAKGLISQVGLYLTCDKAPTSIWREDDDLRDDPDKIRERILQIAAGVFLYDPSVHRPNFGGIDMTLTTEMLQWFNDLYITRKAHTLVPLYLVIALLEISKTL